MFGTYGRRRHLYFVRVVVPLVISFTYSHKRVLGLYCVTLDSGKVKRGESLPIRNVQVRPRVIASVGGQADYLVAHPLQLIVAAPTDLKFLNKVPGEIL